MIIRGVSVVCVDSNVDFAYEVRKKTMHITTFIDYECFKKLKLNSDDFHTIVITFTQNPSKEIRIGNKGLIVHIGFDKEKYLSIRSDTVELHKYLYSLIIEAMKKAHKEYFIVPIDEVLKTMKEFQDLNYVYTWSYKKKKDKNRKLFVELSCRLELDKFSLKLVAVRNGDEEICNRIILETDSDPFAYKYEFKDIIVEEKQIRVTQDYFPETDLFILKL
jgi:hypothetical protein